METNKKSSFSGRLGYVMAAAGSAVGLGKSFGVFHILRLNMVEVLFYLLTLF